MVRCCTMLFTMRKLALRHNCELTVKVHRGVHRRAAKQTKVCKVNESCSIADDDVDDDDDDDD